MGTPVTLTDPDGNYVDASGGGGVSDVSVTNWPTTQPVSGTVLVQGRWSTSSANTTLRVGTTGAIVIGNEGSGDTAAVINIPSDSMSNSDYPGLCVINNNTLYTAGNNWARSRDISAASTNNTTGYQAVVNAPSHSPNAGITFHGGTGGLSGVPLPGGPGNFYAATVTAGDTEGYAIVYNHAGTPAVGSALGDIDIIEIAKVAANQTVKFGGDAHPTFCSKGCVLLFSSSATQYNQLASFHMGLKAK